MSRSEASKGTNLFVFITLSFLNTRLLTPTPGLYTVAGAGALPSRAESDEGSMLGGHSMRADHH